MARRKTMAFRGGKIDIIGITVTSLVEDEKSKTRML